MVKRRKEIEVVVCDFCGADIFYRSGVQCVVCGKDVCDNCNPVRDIAYKAYRIPLCPKHAQELSLLEYIKWAEEHLKHKDC